MEVPADDTTPAAAQNQAESENQSMSAASLDQPQAESVAEAEQ